MTDKTNEIFIVVDAGIVSITLCAINQYAQVLKEDVFPNEAWKQDGGVKFVLAKTQQFIADNHFAIDQIKGIGISTLNVELKIQQRSVLLPFVYKATFEKEFPGIMVRAGNEVLLSALGEYQVTYKAMPRSLYYVSWGNVINGGLVLNGKIMPGHHGVAGNLSHIPIKGVGTKCWCGNIDCLYTYAAGDVFPFHYYKMLEKQKPKDYVSPFEGMAQNAVSIKMIMDASAKGDPICRQIMEVACVAMAKALSIVIHVINPELIILGGEVPTYSSDMVKRLAELTKTQLMYQDTKQTAMVQSKFKNASVIGAFYFVLASVRAVQGKKTGQVLSALKKKKES